jgi:mRNA interferase MazF
MRSTLSGVGPLAVTKAHGVECVRPFVIMTRDAAIGLLISVLAAPVTKSVRGIPTELTLTNEDGMLQDGAATLDNLRVAPKAYLADHIIELGSTRMHQACDAARRALDCE